MTRRDFYAKIDVYTTKGGIALDNKRVTIKDIANELGVSCAIINRALNNKPGVSKVLREKILDAADRLGYRPNRIARGLARLTMEIGIVIPSAWEGFYSFVEKGITEELDRLLDYNVHGSFYHVDNPYSSANYVEKILSCINDGVNGIIIADCYHEGMDEVYTKLKESAIPTVTIGELPQKEIKAIASVCIDSYKSGQMAAQMLMLPLKEMDRVAVFIGSSGNVEHSLKAEGFKGEIKRLGGSFVGCFETGDKSECAEKLFYDLASESLDGIYLATSGSDSVIEAIVKNNLTTKIVATDISDSVRQNITSSNLICTLFQDPEKQGRLAIRTLYDYLSENKLPGDRVILPPQIIIPASLDSLE